MTLTYTGKICGVNSRHTISRGKMILSRPYREFRDILAIGFASQVTTENNGRLPAIANPVSVTARFWLTKRMDIDAPIKAVLDALQLAGIIADDNLVRKLIVDKYEARESRIEIDVEEI